MKPIKLDTMVKVIAVTTLVLLSTGRTDAESAYKTGLRLVEKLSGGYFNDVYRNGTFRTGHQLWDNVLNQCTAEPSVSCLQKNFFWYLDDRFRMNNDLKVSDSVCFKRNNVDLDRVSADDGVNGARSADDSEVEEDEPDSPFEEVTNGLYDKGVNFFMTHDMTLTLPEYFFQGATLKIAPRALTKSGALIHVDLEPRENKNGEGRIFLQKIKKAIKKKLLTALIAIVLVVKLIALKLVFVLPLILGVTTAKKMFLKLLLFLFPALSHIFKLCSWYHQNYHTTKYHHHHHLITHHHKVPHAPVYGHQTHGSVLVKNHGQNSAPGFEHYPQDWELSGPGLGSEYLGSDIHRNAIASFKPHVNDANDINAWGLGLPPGQSMNVGEYSSSNLMPKVVAPNIPQKVPLANIGNVARPVGPPNINPYNRNKKTTTKDPFQAEKEALIRAAALAARAPPSPVRDELLRVSAVKLKETNRVQTETDLVKQQQQILAANDPDTIAAEKFYGFLLDRVDAVLATIGASETGCKERAVCTLYGDPFKHAPFSNLVSNELSKDSNELLPAADSKQALRYYRYVQAARDGQEQKDCNTEYPHCDIDYNIE
ncbi:uncharacterized protein LOC101742205 [Bombyx mori]|uniref:Uncharacterized protein n=1 Tax=Bombyx mori TaxID=7091 RepID=A0A8R2AKU1_BOMMO|nr:uncharacterized protein LOC101742205 [Bombyx mori]